MKAEEIKKAIWFDHKKKQLDIILDIDSKIIAYIEEFSTDKKPLQQGPFEYIRESPNEINISIPVENNENFDQRVIKPVIKHLDENGFKISEDYYDDKYHLTISWKHHKLELSESL